MRATVIWQQQGLLQWRAVPAGQQHEVCSFHRFSFTNTSKCFLLRASLVFVFPRVGPELSVFQPPGYFLPWVSGMAWVKTHPSAWNILNLHFHWCLKLLKIAPCLPITRDVKILLYGIKWNSHLWNVFFFWNWDCFSMEALLLYPGYFPTAGNCGSVGRFLGWESRKLNCSPSLLFLWHLWKLFLPPEAFSLFCKVL